MLALKIPFMEATATAGVGVRRERQQDGVRWRAGRRVPLDCLRKTHLLVWPSWGREDTHAHATAALQSRKTTVSWLPVGGRLLRPARCASRQEEVAPALPCLGGGRPRASDGGRLDGRGTTIRAFPLPTTHAQALVTNRP